jgi:hypothetical protein
MKLHVVFDREGNIVGAARVDVRPALRARPLPDEHEGHRSADVYVPVEYGHYDLAGVCQRLRVDPTAKFPELKPRD